MSFDGSAYRRGVLAALRDRSPAEVEDLFWLAEVPRDADDATVAEQLKATRGFLFKERTRARQAAVASAVLAEWPRIEATLLDPAARAALRQRLEASPSAAPEAAASRPKPAGDRRRRQVGASLAELARLRDDPDLATDLYAFLGLPTSATREMLATRIERIGDVNRRRRPDRERTLVDELLAHARKLLLEGDPQEYLAGDVVDALVAGDLDAARAARDRGVPDSAIVAAARRVPGPVPLAALGLAEAHALAEVDALPVQAREAHLRELLERNPGWRLVAGRLAALPPAPPREVTVAIEHNEALISWSAPSPAPDAYLVERHAPGGSRVLGRTHMLSWTDSAPREGGVTWTVRALRGSAAASEPVTAAAPHAPGVTDLVAVAARPVVLTWTAPAGARLVLTRTRGDVRRTIRPDHDGYVDRHVELGATYEYTVEVEGVAASARSVTVTVTPNPAVSELVVRRREDGRVEATWTWPPGTTEVFVAWGQQPPTSAAVGRKVTNTRYEIDGGAVLDGVPAGAHIAVFAGTRSASGNVEWSVEAPPSARSLV